MPARCVTVEVPLEQPLTALSQWGLRAVIDSRNEAVERHRHGTADRDARFRHGRLLSLLNRRSAWALSGAHDSLCRFLFLPLRLASSGRTVMPPAAPERTPMHGITSAPTGRRRRTSRAGPPPAAGSPARRHRLQA